MPAVRRILLCGVGGQGVLTTARLLGEAAHAQGLAVRVGQLHGMSQRGGSVEAWVLLGPGESPFPLGPFDALIGFEPLEALRAVGRLDRRAVAVVNRRPIVPPALTRQGRSCPDLETALDTLRAATAALVAVDGDGLARAAGDPRALGAALVGALLALDHFGLDPSRTLAALAGSVPQRAASLARASDLGAAAARAAAPAARAKEATS